jgi:lipoate-protein ligase A
VILEHVTYEDDVTAGMQARFVTQSELVRDALAGLGADARIGELAREYCPGAHSVNVGGRVKVAGIAQRAIRHGAMTNAVIVAGGGADVRALVADVYAALELDVDPATAGSLDEALPGLSADTVTAAVRAAYARLWELEEQPLDERLLATARVLADRHRAR